MRNALPLIWRKIKSRYNLMGSHCETCKKDYFPEKSICPTCRRKGKIVDKQMPTEGKIVCFSKIHAAPKGFEHETPYFVALIELTNGVRLFTMLVNAADDEVKIGQKAVMRFRKIFEDGEHGVIGYGYKFQALAK